MDKFLAAQTVTRTITLVNNDGTPISPTAASYRLLDESGNELVAATPVPGFSSGDGTAVIEVSPADNTLATGVSRALREIELTLTLPGGQVVQTDSYMVEILNGLAIPSESFQTLGKAELTAATIPGLIAWPAASRDDKISALVQARNNIAGLSFRRIWANYQNRIEYEIGQGITMGIDVLYLFLLTPAEFADLDADFKTALNRAQVLEADFLLDGDPVQKRREQGIVMEKVGEVTTMFRNGKPGRKPISEKAMRAIAMYVDDTISIGRA